MADKQPESLDETRAMKEKMKENKRITQLTVISSLTEQLRRLKVEAKNDEAMTVLASHVTEPLHEALMMESDSIRGDFKIKHEMILAEIRKLRLDSSKRESAPHWTYYRIAFIFLTGVVAGLLLARVLGGVL